MNTDLERIAREAFAGEPDPVQDGRRIIFTAVMVAWVAFGAIALGLVLLLLGGKAEAHEAPSGWRYPLVCCSNRDCTMVRADKVRETPDGYVVRLVPGDHDFLTAPATFVIPYTEAKTSPDGEYHLCISRALNVLCFFAGGRVG